MRRKLNIDYNWRCVSFPEGLPDVMVETLENEALYHITEMLKEGFIEGELCAYVQVLSDGVQGVPEPEDGYECRGWFKIDKEII